MEKIVLALRELKKVMMQVSIAHCMLDAMLVFMVLYLGFYLIYIDGKFAFLLAFLYFVVNTSIKVRALNLEAVEEKAPALKNQLTTSADNLSKPGEIVQLLHLDVLRQMKEIQVSSFINYKRIWRQLMMMAVLTFAVLTLSAFDVRLMPYQDIVTGFASKEIYLPNDIQLELQAGQPTGSGDIFGNENVAELGQNEIQLQINPVLSEINLDDIKEAEKKDFEKQDLLKEDIVATTDSSFDEKISKEHKEVVKKYFSKISEKK